MSHFSKLVESEEGSWEPVIYGQLVRSATWTCYWHPTMQGFIETSIYSQLMRSTEVSECRNKKQSRKESNDTLRGTTDGNNTPWPGMTATTCMSISQQEVLVRNTELASYHQPEDFGKGQMEWGAASACVLPVSQNPSYWNPSWLNDVCATKDSESEWLTRNSLKTHSIPVKPKTVSHAAEQFPWVPLPCCALPRCPFPTKSLALSAHVSPQTIHFWVLEKSPLSGSGRGPPFLQPQLKQTFSSKTEP